MDEHTLSARYEDAYDLASRRPEQGDDEETRFFANLAPKVRKLRVLDLGCAEGRLALMLSKEGHEVTAADISARQLAKVVELARARSLPIRTVKCNIEDGIEAFAGATFDLVYFMDIVEHLKNPIAWLENVRRLLAPDGTLVVHTPNVFNLARIARYIVRRRRLEDYYAPGRLRDLHLQTYDYLTLEKTLNFVGLRVQEVVPTRASLPKLSQAKRLFPLYRAVAKAFPFLGDTLLLKCRRTEPIDVERLVASWPAGEPAHQPS
jgi:2-polyprenyl-3-methyl-5-hydroxy-6-metoxy-1,4-benzoquinol methylase